MKSPVAVPLFCTKSQEQRVAGFRFPKVGVIPPYDVPPGARRGRMRARLKKVLVSGSGDRLDCHGQLAREELRKKKITPW